MNLRPYVESIHRQLAVTAEAGGEEARALAEQLGASLDAAVRLALQDALAAAAEEITCELAPGSVELRLRGREPEFVVTAPPASAPAEADEPPAAPPTWGDGDDMARINLRMPEQLKSRIETAASAEGLSVNAWLARVAAAAVDRTGRTAARDQRAPQGAEHYRGWAR